MTDSMIAAARSLQRELSGLDEPSGRFQPTRRPGFSAALIQRLAQLKIKMYQERGHALPHLHVDYGKQHHVASYSLDPPARLEGDLDTKYDRKIVGWIAVHKAQLLKVWNRLQAGDRFEMELAALRGDGA